MHRTIRQLKQSVTGWKKGREADSLVAFNEYFPANDTASAAKNNQGHYFLLNTDSPPPYNS